LQTAWGKRVKGEKRAHTFGKNIAERGFQVELPAKLYTRASSGLLKIRLTTVEGQRGTRRKPTYLRKEKIQYQMRIRKVDLRHPRQKKTFCSQFERGKKEKKDQVKRGNQKGKRGVGGLAGNSD